MFKEVKVGDKVLPMRASGRTPLYYRQVFHKDILEAFSQEGNQIVMAAENIPEVAYIMAMNGSDQDMSKLNEDTFAEWLEQFEAMDLVMAGEAIFGVYLPNLTTTSTPKKKASAKQSAS
jgi:hypothetical protein